MFGKETKKTRQQERIERFADNVENRLEATLNSLLSTKLNTIDKMLSELLIDPVQQSEVIESLKKQVQDEKNRLSEAKCNRKNEERELKVLIKIAEQQNLIDIEKTRLDIKHEYLDKEMKLMRDYHDRQIAQLVEAKADLEKIYGEIMRRLPNVNLQMESIHSNQALSLPEAKTDAKA